jgi:hypothetical protein
MAFFLRVFLRQPTRPTAVARHFNNRNIITDIDQLNKEMAVTFGPLDEDMEGGPEGVSRLQRAHFNQPDRLTVVDDPRFKSTYDYAGGEQLTAELEEVFGSSMQQFRRYQNQAEESYKDSRLSPRVTAAGFTPTSSPFNSPLGTNSDKKYDANSVIRLLVINGANVIVRGRLKK